MLIVNEWSDKMIYGNTDGIKKVLIDKLEKLYEHKVQKDIIIEEDILKNVFEFSVDINREISLSINRKGEIINITIGDSSKVDIPIIDIKEKRLSGIRIVHTHPDAGSRLSAIDISALLKLKLDCIAAAGIDEKGSIEVSCGFCSVKDNILETRCYGPMDFRKLDSFIFLDKVHIVEDMFKKLNIEEKYTEKAILVGIQDEKSLYELRKLSEACNIEVMDEILQKKGGINGAFFVGRGKAEEISIVSQIKGANLIIFDDELTGSQVKNLEEMTGAKVIDRTTLILEIFARRAKSKESIIQVEIAQLKYRLPRLYGLGTVLSRTGGGIGTRGPGEKKLEVDKRHIKDRIYDLNSELEKIKKNRQVQRIKRNKLNIPEISIVGYTNAGKSTLRNELCSIARPDYMEQKQKVFEADMLFATLDVTTRVIKLPNGEIAAITDTVGFINKLPHDLVEAFKSTLEEVSTSDLLLLVVDASDKDAGRRIDVVNKVLGEIGVKDKKIVLVFNKMDLTQEENIKVLRDKYKDMPEVEISAKKHINLEELLNVICEELPQKLKNIKCVIPYDDYSIVSLIHENASINEEKYCEGGTYIDALVDEKIYNKCFKYIKK